MSMFDPEVGSREPVPALLGIRLGTAALLCYLIASEEAMFGICWLVTCSRKN